MSGSSELYLLGYSGHAYVVADIAIRAEFEISGYFDKLQSLLNPYSLEYLGIETNYKCKLEKPELFFPAVGDNLLRKRLVDWIELNNQKQLKLIDKSAMVSFKAIIGLSSIVCVNAVVNSMARIGKGVIINTSAVIEHECDIGDFAHIAPGAILAGAVTVGNFSFIGANSFIKQGKTIGDNVIIGAGSVVLNDIPDNEVWVGNPARKIK